MNDPVDPPGSIGADPDVATSVRAEPGAARRDHRPHLSTIARGGFLNMIGAVASGVLNFVLVVVVTRGLGAAGAGAFFVSVALFSLLSKTLELGADTGLVRSISRDLALGRARDVRRTIVVALGPVLVASAVAAILVHVNASALASALAKGSDPEVVAPLLRVLAVFLPIAPAATVMLAATRGCGTMVPTVLVDRIAKPALQPILVLAVLATGMGTTAVVTAWAGPIGLTALLAAFWMLALIRSAEETTVPDMRAPSRPAELAAAFWRFAAPRGLAGFFHVAIAWVDTLLIGALRSTREAGVYAAATRYLLVGTFATVAVVQVMGPKISELIARRDHDASRSVYQVSTGWLVLLTWPVNFTIVLFTPVLLSLFGREFAAGEVPLLILGSAMFIATAAGPVDVVLLMAGKSSWNLANTLIALTLNVGLNLLLIPPLGITGAAIAWAVSIATNNLLPLAQTWTALRLHPFGRGVRVAAVLSGVAFGGVGLLFRLVLGQTATAFALYAIVSTGLYLGLLWRFRDDLDLGVVRNAVGSAVRRGAQGASRAARRDRGSHREGGSSPP